MRPRPLPVALAVVTLVAVAGVLQATSTRGGDGAASVAADGHVAVGGPERAHDPAAGLLDRVLAASDWSALRDVPSDSALDELSVGRFWHGTLLLRAEGMARSAPENVLLLAAAEAGWQNWPAVRELLEDVD
ncbi:MAG: hypothetical protein LC667_09990, partial [Thioalkalivibrio sp.]|nr:hypothetical protein [Thioalkalivibrio sp.]